MIKEIEPITHWHTNKGLVTLTHAAVDIGSHRLGEPVRGNIELGLMEGVPTASPGATITRFYPVVNGTRNLTPEQKAAWSPGDDEFFAAAIITNAGLKVKAPAVAPVAL